MVISSSSPIVPRTSQEKGEKKRAGLDPDAICMLVIRICCKLGVQPEIYSFEKIIESLSKITILSNKQHSSRERSFNMFTAPAEFYRLDPLTGCNNFLSFVETLSQYSARTEKRPFSILHADLNHLYMLNESKGRTYGDSVVRWMEIVLREESNAATYRIGGDQFSVILTAETTGDSEKLANRIFARLNREGEQLGIPTPAARIALVHYDEPDNYSLYDMMFQLGETMFDVKSKRDRRIHVYHARDLIKSEIRAGDTNLHDSTHTQEVLRWIANDTIGHLFFMGRMLDIAQLTSYLDAISGLPNIRAALMKIEKEIASKLPFAVLLMDGDNIRTFNDVSYACGDDMIQKVSAVLSDKLRPGDFVARWRSGDEFVAILPNTSGEGGRIVAERFCSAIKEASQSWMFPTSITVGIATYPEHGSDVNTLVDVAEKAMKKGKDEGKDRVVLVG
jgi:diguanylate cyclase (GGDEF)-like protein